jgi:hypothetical protein
LTLQQRQDGLTIGLLLVNALLNGLVERRAADHVILGTHSGSHDQKGKTHCKHTPKHCHLSLRL